MPVASADSTAQILQAVSHHSASVPYSGDSEYHFFLCVSETDSLTITSCFPQIRRSKQIFLTVSLMGIGSPVRINLCVMKPFESLDGQREIDSFLWLLNEHS